MGHNHAPMSDDRDVVLRTERLVLTSWLPTDVGPLFEMHSDPEAMRFVRSGRPESLAESEQLVEQYMTEHRERGWTKWRLAARDGALVGRAGFGGNNTRRGLSYAIHREHWGQGLATEIASALVLWHWEHAAEAELRALVEVGNDASVAVLRKVGFEQTSTEPYEHTVCHVFAHPCAAEWLAAPLVTSRLVLRPWRAGDETAIAALKTDPKVRKFLGGALSPDKAATTARAQIAARTWGHFVLTDVRDGPAFGTLTLDRKRGQWEVSFQMSPSRWGQGLMSEAVATAAAWFFAQCPEEPLIAVTQVANIRTRRLLGGLGAPPTREFEEQDVRQIEYCLPRMHPVGTGC